MSRLLLSLRARWRLRCAVRLYWHPDYVPRELSRARLAVDRVPRALGQIEGEGLLRPGDLRRPRPATYDQLALVHTPAYLEATTRPGPLARVFGLDDVDVDDVLGWQRRVVGGTIAAFRAAAIHGCEVAVNLGGGFHHAEPDRGSGFCVFNDVAVALACLRQDGFRGRVAVVDLDFHEGEGTRAALAGDPTVTQFSIHGALRHLGEPPAPDEIVLAPGTGDQLYLATLRSALRPFLERSRPAFMVYVAGHDVLQGDPLGGFSLTLGAALARDRLVLREARRLRVPVVVLLGGGYAEAAWLATANLLRSVLTGRGRVHASEAPGLRARFERIAAGIDEQELQRDVALDLTMDDLMADLGGTPAATRLLDHYTRHGVEYGLERYGILSHLRRLGYHDLEVSMDVAYPWRQAVRVEGRPAGGPRVRLVEIVGRRRHLALPPPWPTEKGAIEVVAVEWLLLQDPSASFTLERPRLPGQQHPGLGLGAGVGEMLRQCARRLGLAGVLARPAHFHNARRATGFRFVDPAAEGRFQALHELLARVSLDEATALVEAGSVRLASGAGLTWEPADQLLPVSDEVAAYFASPEYEAAVEAARSALVAAGLQIVAPAA